MIGKPMRTFVRGAFPAAVILILGGMGTANLVCALLYKAVFMVRGGGWTYLDASPTAFMVSVAASLVIVIFSAMASYSIFVSVKAEKSWRRLQDNTPRYEQESHTAAYEPREPIRPGQLPSTTETRLKQR